jgi:thioesterase domain-containing protein/acyl carrier protein
MVQVADAIAEVTGFVGQILPTDDFINDLGGTSLGIVRVLSKLEQTFACRLRMSDALADTSVAGLTRLVTGDSGSSTADFAFNQEGSSVPIFLLHVYLGGMLRLRRLAELLPPDQPAYGIQVYTADSLDDDGQAVSLLAQQAVERIRAIQPSGPVTVAGHSAGGLMALEVARQLRGSRETEPRVLLIDSVKPLGTLGYYWGEALLNVPELRTASFGEFVRRCRAAWRRFHVPPRDTGEYGLVGLTERDEALTNRLIRHHRVQTYRGSVTVMRTRQGKVMALGRRDLGWSSVVDGTVNLIDIRGTHIGALDHPNLLPLAEKVNRWVSGE